MRRNSNSSRFLDQTGPAPGAPESLKRHGRALWATIQNQYDIRDSGGVETLVQICHAADRAAECAKKIEAEGLVVASSSGTPRDHPLIKHELAARAFVTKALRALGLNVEPLRRGPGRPPASVPVPYGISTEDGEDDDVGLDADAR